MPGQGYYLTPDAYRTLTEMFQWWQRNKNQRDKYRRRGGGFQQVAGTDISIFRIVSAATGDGVYNCYEQTLDATEWPDTAGDDRLDDKDTTSVEVLNLLEHHVHATYARALATGDRIAAWEMTDDEGTTRWIGIPIGPYNEGRVVLAKCQEAASGTDLFMSVKLCDQDGSEIGSAFDVTCKVSGGATHLHDVFPRFASGDPIFVTNITGTWYCAQILPFISWCA